MAQTDHKQSHRNIRQDPKYESDSLFALDCCSISHYQLFIPRDGGKVDVAFLHVAQG